ncbi:FAD-binding domain-containing protein [Devosia psychrophila]|uniref:Deoxyribodipyrimidine photolyase n=1 Tax=Devosia psychrophila TaxID=728005 RepID=A0A0F5PR73_9HYPH|nr:FAD-binding domain-containing protein [Devosia psychrophila]KKC31085.1 deoxyribodipyrimidine photolyase [Devosia psychrophila]SFD13677.1 FAD binding domain of DNA photolyase [Devosia psychrophila]
MTDWTPTRAEGEKLLAAFTRRMGRRYANGRNTDHGPGAHKAVSVLSPYIRRRLVLESDAVAAALAEHGPEDAEKFVQEVIWRGYFKGWLERRPQVWASYRTGLEGDLSALDRDRRLRRDVDRAMNGQTGLACFDAWATELMDTGYLHNHARMWFASIWIFTLGLPWRLGADFFYRHLLDGDAASNTLGWRWVAGLHTRGKPYLADAQNIATFTAGRFTPRHGDLADVTQGLEATEPDGLPTVLPLRAFKPPQPGRPTALLITDEDCRVEDFDLAALDIRTTATLSVSHLRSPLPVSDLVQRFEDGALADAALRSGFTLTVMRASDPAALAKWATGAGAMQIATPYITRGPLHDWLDEAAPSLAKAGISFCEWRRDWDTAIWPHATAGFFRVKQNIPHILDQVLPA